ncbi:MAG: L,D-transpeptidase family protein, partial [Mycobacterium sp.]
SQEGRHGIGIHGGGTGLEDPYADEQGWVKTHGCFRVQNQDLRSLCAELHLVHTRKAHVLLSIKHG